MYIEKSVKAALNDFLFAPNDGRTWVDVIERVSDFLARLWSQGGLVGTKANDAFDVKCGLGSTMTGTDIVEGNMIVLTAVAVIHPAEFIELTFKQQMQRA